MFKFYFLVVTYGIAFIIIGVCLQQTCLQWRFHILLIIKDKTEKPKVIEPSRQFSHLFDAYTEAINKRHHRTGSLFEKNFQRKHVTTESYFRKLIFYIHNNPLHHGFVKQMSLYPWSSYESVVSEKPTMLNRTEVFDLYGTK